MAENAQTRKRDSRPGTITAYIRQPKLLPGEEIDRILHEVPKGLIRYQPAYADGHLPLSQAIQIQMQASEGSNAA
jgi:hypothetical protein